MIVLASLLTACVYPLAPRPEEGPELGVIVEFPEKVGTKGTVGELPGYVYENSLHSLQVWVFNSDNHALVGYKNINEEDFPIGDRVRRYSLPVTKEFAETLPKVDVYILANAASIGLEGMDDLTPWSVLDGALIEDDETILPYKGFGVANPVHQVSPEKGLPFSGVGKSMTVQGEAPDLRVSAITIQRTVSRIRFIFCKTTTPQGGTYKDVSIDRIVLAGWQIPLQDSVFTTQSTGEVITPGIQFYDNFYSGVYEIPWPEGKTLVENVAPEDYLYVNQNPSEYEQLLTEAATEGKLTDLGYTYFRESSIPLEGSIRYYVNGEAKERAFRMEDRYDFSRNHTWTVYGYFVSGRYLQLSLRVLPWDYNRITVNFDEDVLLVSQKFWVEQSTADSYRMTSKDHYDVKLKSNSPVKGHFVVVSPVGGVLRVKGDGDSNYFSIVVSPETINPTFNGGQIDVSISKKEDAPEDWSGKSIILSFAVETADGREIDANSDIVDQVFRFVL